MHCRACSLLITRNFKSSYSLMTEFPYLRIKERAIGLSFLREKHDKGRNRSECTQFERQVFDSP